MVTVPYIKGKSEALTRILKMYDLRSSETTYCIEEYTSASQRQNQ